MRERLADLRRLGASQFDGPALRLIEELVSRAESLKGRAAVHVVERAKARLDLFEARFFEARSRCEALLEKLQKFQSVATLRERFDQGFLKAVESEAGQRLSEIASEDVEAEKARVQKLIEQVKARSVSLDRETRSAVETFENQQDAFLGQLHALGDRLAEALFKETASQARASVIVSRAQNRVPDARGPYNPEALSAHCLKEIASLSPGYLRSILNYFTELQVLEQLEEPHRRGRKKK